MHRKKTKITNAEYLKRKNICIYIYKPGRLIVKPRYVGMINDHLIIFAWSFQQHFDQNVVFVAMISFSGPKIANRLGERTYLHGSASEIRPLLLCTSELELCQVVNKCCHWSRSIPIVMHRAIYVSMHMTIKCNRAPQIYVNINLIYRIIADRARWQLFTQLVQLTVIFVLQQNCQDTAQQILVSAWCMMSGLKCNPVRPGTFHKLMVLGIIVKRAFHSSGDMMFGCVCLRVWNKFSLEDIHNWQGNFPLWPGRSNHWGCQARSQCTCQTAAK